MSKKVDMFKASKEMSTRVADFMRVQVYNATLQTRYKRDMKAMDEKIEKTPDILKGSIFADDLDNIIAGLVAEKEEIAEKYQKLREEAEKFEFTKADNEFYKEYKNGNVKAGLIAWGKEYGLELEDTDFLGVLAYGISGVKTGNARTIIKSEGKEFTQTRNKGDILKVMYGLLSEKMLMVGTLKPETIPEDVRHYYDKKRK